MSSSLFGSEPDHVNFIIRDECWHDDKVCGITVLIADHTHKVNVFIPSVSTEDELPEDDKETVAALKNGQELRVVGALALSLSKFYFL